MRYYPIHPKLSKKIINVIKSPSFNLPYYIRYYLETHLNTNFPTLPTNTRKSCIYGLIVGLSNTYYENEAEKMAIRAITQTAKQHRHDFSNIKIHDNKFANCIAKELGARAFALGNHVVMGENQYAPNTLEGLYLLAHEFSHILQQRNSGIYIIQRAEVGDTFLPKGIKLDDLKSDLNKKVNKDIYYVKSILKVKKDKNEMTKLQMKVRSSLIEDSESFTSKSYSKKKSKLSKDKRKELGFEIAKFVFRELGEVHFIFKHLAKIEIWANNLNIATTEKHGKIYHPSSNLTRYAGINSVVLQKGFLSPLVKIDGILIGTDKIGHFFQLGYAYFCRKFPKNTINVGEEDVGEELGSDKSELGLFGLATTGVYSNADIAANRAGAKFYENLMKNYNMKFDISNYITNDWNEAINQNYYISKIAEIVWTNVLTKTWNGEFTVGKEIRGKQIKTKLDVSKSKISGTYIYKSSEKKSIKGKILNGTIIFHKSAIHNNAVTHILIEFYWNQAKESGKGKWVSINEKTLEGTWGFDSSEDNGGKWNLFQ